MTKAQFEKEVAKQMAVLGISKEEAEDLVRFDNDEISNEDADALTAKAKSNRQYVSTEAKKSTRVREYKVDEAKMQLLTKLLNALPEIAPIAKVKNDSEFSFTKDGVGYTVKLIKHR